MGEAKRTIKDAAALWGCSVETVERWVAKGHVHSTQEGGRVYVHGERPSAFEVEPPKGAGGGEAALFGQASEARESRLTWRMVAFFVVLAGLISLLVGLWLYRALEKAYPPLRGEEGPVREDVRE